MKVELDGSQIDQCVLLSKSLLSLFPDQDHGVQIEGCFTRNPGSQPQQFNGYVFDANSYGYFRTLLVRITEPTQPSNDDVLTIGGRNAIVENVALHKCTFDLSNISPVDLASKSHWVDSVTDSRLLQFEFLEKGAIQIGDLLARVTDELRDRNLDPTQRLVKHWSLTTRLKRLRKVWPSHQFEEQLPRLLSMATNSVEPDLLMFLSEAIWFWLDEGPLPISSQNDIERVLQIGLYHSDPNIRLAAVISCTSYIQQQSALDPQIHINLLHSLGRLLADSYLHQSVFFSQVLKTCKHILPDLQGEYYQDLLDAVSFLEGVEATSDGLAQWLANDAIDAQEIARFLCGVLWKSRIVEKVSRIQIPNYISTSVQALKVELRIQERYEVYVLCAVQPDDIEFDKWENAAIQTGSLPKNANTMRIAARRQEEFSYNPLYPVISGGAFVELVYGDKELDNLLLGSCGVNI